jgi:Ca2+-binding RTX toxin-like protein
MLLRSARPSYLLEPGLDAAFTGTAGNDTQAGTSDNDVFDYSQGGNDTLSGAGGNDTFKMGGTFTALDQIDGGEGEDTLVFDGDYYNSNPITPSNLSITNIETIKFKSGNSYVLNLHDATVGAGQVLTIDASGLASENFVFFDGENETDGNIVYEGAAGFDFLTMGFGDDRINGNGGNDTVFFNGGYGGGDIVDGGNGSDSVHAAFSESFNLTMGTASLLRVEALNLNATVNAGNIGVTLFMDDSNVAAGATMLIGTGSTQGALLTLDIDGSAETDGHFRLFDGTGNDTLVAGGISDEIAIGGGGDDTVSGGGGDDIIFARLNATMSAFSSLNAADTLDGGNGFDTLVVQGSLGAFFQAAPTTMHRIEALVFEADYDYVFALDPTNVDQGETLVVDASALASDRSLQFFTFDGDSRFEITGGAGNDALHGGSKSDNIRGGAGDDQLVGLKGADTLIGGTGTDECNYGNVKQSSGLNYDTIVGFDFQHDLFALTTKVTGIDAEVEGGTLRTGHFNDDLAAAIGAGELDKHHAVLFAPDDGDLAGRLFLIVESRGEAGYQAGKDYVFDLKNAEHLNFLNKDDFIVSA